MELGPHSIHSKEHDPEKTGFKEKRSEYFEGNHGPDRRPGKLSKLRKAQTKLKGKNDAGYYTDSEAHCENALPEAVDLEVKSIPSLEPETFYHSKEHGEPNGHGGKDNVKAHREGELHAGERSWIQAHVASPSAGTRRTRTTAPMTATSSPTIAIPSPNTPMMAKKNVTPTNEGTRKPKIFAKVNERFFNIRNSPLQVTMTIKSPVILQ